jgi:hypothetical protein
MFPEHNFPLEVGRQDIGRYRQKASHIAYRSKGIEIILLFPLNMRKPVRSLPFWSSITENGKRTFTFAPILFPV